MRDSNSTTLTTLRSSVVPPFARETETNLNLEITMGTAFILSLFSKSKEVVGRQSSKQGNR